MKRLYSILIVLLFPALVFGANTQVTIPNISGGERAIPAGTDKIPIHDGTSTKWTALSSMTTVFQGLDADLTSWAAITRAANFDTFVATPTSANLAAAVTNETGAASGTPLLVFNVNPTLTGATMAGNLTLNANEIQSTTDITIQLGDAAGSNKFIIQDSGGAEIFSVDSNGGMTAAASASPTDTQHDSDAPGTDKEVSKQVAAYIDGADGAENGTYTGYVHEGGTSTAYWEADGKNVQFEINKPLVMMSSDDPDLTAASQMSYDTDGWIRAYSTSQKAIARIQDEIHVTCVKPQDMADAVRDAFEVWSNESGMSFIITGYFVC